MAKFLQDIELSGFILPQDGSVPERKNLHDDISNKRAYSERYDKHTLFYDCFWDAAAAQIVLVCPRMLNLESLFAEADFYADGQRIVIGEIERLSRCAIVKFDVMGDAPRVLRVSHDLFGGNVPVGGDFLEAYRGTNAMFVLSKNNKLTWIQDWLSYNVQEHGANAVVFADNTSTKYGRAQLLDAIGEVDGIETASVVRARYPFGPTDEKYDNALYLQRSLTELFRRRFLAHARAVIVTDIDELFYSRSGRSIFDATVESEEGYVRADARWVYTNYQTASDGPRHRDHGYVTVRGRPKSNRKYAVAPEGAQQGKQWLTHFINGRRDPVDPDFELWHFRHLNTGWKLDRTSSDGELEEYEPLKTAMETVFGVPEVPRALTEEEIREDRANRRKLIITAMKNESSFILEWVAYHRAIGFDDFLVYTNDCTDNTVELLQALQRKGVLVHEENEVLRRGPQKSALLYARTHPLVEKADWILVSDIDEFLNIHIADGHVDDLINLHPTADAIPVTWKIFGCDGVVEFEDEPVITSFFDGEAPRSEGGLKKRFVKTLFRPTDDIERFGTHGPVPVDGVEITWVAPDGRVLGEDDNLTRPKKDFAYDIAQINHYAVGSVDAFLVKRDRGRVNHYRQTMDIDYWNKMNRSGEEDRSILRHKDAMMAELDALLEDPEIRKLHEEGVAWRQSRIAELKDTPAFAEMRQTILDDLG